ncbi:MAG: hypothetical protein JWN44_6691, partial [Myxococcales bacterium]|nr:hypothetical protein [Myxococcales bacterium]
NCLGVGNCVLQCVVGGTGDINSCFTMCSKQGKTGSANKWATAFQCGQDYCAPPSDMLGKCASVTIPAGEPGAGGQILCDQGLTYAQCQAMTSMTCIPCINNARNLIFGDFTVDPQNPGPPTGMCPDPASPDCKGGAVCTTKINACTMDL